MKDLSTGSIPGHIATMSMQMAVGILVQTLYSFTDLYFVSKLGDQAIAGVTSAGNVWFIVLALTQILNVGTVALVAHAVGARQQDRANLVFNQSLSLSFAMGAVVFVGVYLGSGHYMHTVAADDPEIAPNTTHVATVVIGRLAFELPNSDFAHATRRPEMPPAAMISPAKIKNGTASRAALSSDPNITWWSTVSGIE